MLRFFIWKILFEIENLKAIFFPSRGSVYYFGFGAMLNPEVLSRRKIFPKSEKWFELKGHRLTYGRASPFQGIGFASVVEDKASSVWGKIYELKASEVARLDLYELHAVFRMYEKKWLRQQGELFFCYQSTTEYPDLLPSEEYLAKILKGMQDAPPEAKGYINQLRQTPSLEIKAWTKIPVLHPRFAKSTGFLTQLVRPWVVFYERACFWVFVHLLQHHSLFERFIKKS